MGTTTSLLLIAAAALAVLAVLVALVALTRTRRDARRLATDLAALGEEHDRLRGHLDDLEGRLRQLRAAVAVPEARDADGYLITDAGEPLPAPVGTEEVPVPDQLVLSAALGEPLVRAVALGHGVRRALSAESRNRIRFEVRREIRRSRKQRRRDLKAAYRHLQQQAGEA